MPFIGERDSSENTSNSRPVQCSWIHITSQYRAAAVWYNSGSRLQSNSEPCQVVAFSVIQWTPNPKQYQPEQRCTNTSGRKVDGTQTRERWKTMDMSEVLPITTSKLSQSQSWIEKTKMFFLERCQWGNLTSFSQVDKSMIIMWLWEVWEPTVAQEYAVHIKSGDEINLLKMRLKSVSSHRTADGLASKPAYLAFFFLFSLLFFLK